MNDQKQYGPRDQASAPEMDTYFIGVDERLAPQMLPVGYVAAATNKRFRNGRAATRDGITMLPWMKTDGKTPFTEVYGAAVFNDPNQSGQWILIAADGGVWKTRPNFVCQAVPMPAGVTLTRATCRKFLQANGAILLLRGLDNAVLQCTNLEEGFKPIIQVNTWGATFDHATNWVGLAAHSLLIGDPVQFDPSGGTGLPASVTSGQTYYVLDTPTPDNFTISADPGGDPIVFNTGVGDAVVNVGQVTVLDGASPIPPAEDGIFFGNRVLLIDGKDTCLVSDIGDYTRYLPLQNEFRINEGDSYTLVAVTVFNEDTIVFLKSGNVQKVTGVQGDLSDAQGPLNVTEAYGAVGARAAAAFGSQLFWLNSELRVASLSLTELNQEQGTDVALSDPLVKTFGRLNAAYAAAARLAVADGFLFCALPLDEAEIVGDAELVPAGQFYTLPATAVTVNGLTAGKVYQYRQGRYGGSLVNGTETLTGDSNFTAQGASVNLYGNPTLDYFGHQYAVEETVRQVVASGVNTAVAVYDFLNQAWAGVDEALGVTHVVDWLKFEYGGRPRLGFIGADGWLHLYGEGYEDDKLVTATPYVDLLVDRVDLLDLASTVQVNGGTAVTTRNGTANSGTQWGLQASVAQANLWRDAVGKGGYDATAGTPWTAPNTTPEQIDGGVRFTATNGVVPSVKVNGVVTANGRNGWALVDAHGTQEITSVPIADRILTRAYRCMMPYSQAGPEMKRFAQMAMQVATWAPQYTLRAVVQGFGAGANYVTDEMRDGTRYFSPFDAAAWDATNANDDFDAPRREDYSLALTAAGMLQGSGFTPDAVQEYIHRVPVDERGLWMQLEVSNADGRLELLAVAMEAAGAEVLSGPAVA